MFVNFSNHPSIDWDSKQKKAAEKYGEIKDIRFPAVFSRASEQEIQELAEESVSQIMSNFSDGDAVMVQGEFTLSFAVVRILKQHDIKVVSACSERVSIETTDETGNKVKQSKFSFVKFREYV
jgi:hypothetical protein